MNAPIDPVHKDDEKIQHESDEESSKTPTDSEEECTIEYLRTKKCQEQGATSIAAMEAQLNQLLQAITNATDGAAKEMNKFVQGGFPDIRS